MRKDIPTNTEINLLAAALMGGNIPSLFNEKHLGKMCSDANKNRCVECLCKIPPGKAGRKCKRCRT